MAIRFSPPISRARRGDADLGLRPIRKRPPRPPGHGRDSYRNAMAELFAPMTQVAALNPHSMSPEVRTPRRAGDRHRVQPDDPAIPIPAGWWRGTRPIRARRSQSPPPAWRGAWACWSASSSTSTAAPICGSECPWSAPTCLAAQPRCLPLTRRWTARRVSLSDIDLFDLYSCFPIAVFNILDGLGLAADDPRPLTVAGGLPFFGGAGNNYSMHAIAMMVRGLRKRRGAKGLVGANGGFLSKYSVGVYSTDGRGRGSRSTTAPRRRTSTLVRRRRSGQAWGWVRSRPTP